MFAVSLDTGGKRWYYEADKGRNPERFLVYCGYVWIEEMELRVHRDIFDAISPLDHRYCASSPELWERLSAYLSEAATIRYQAKVEAALVSALARRGPLSRRAAEEVERAAREVTPAEVYREEQRTRHNVRALVNCIRARVSDEAKPFVHLTATSMDIIDTARALQLRDATRRSAHPAPQGAGAGLIAVARREAETRPGRQDPWPTRRPDHLWLRDGRVCQPAGPAHPGLERRRPP